MKKTSISIQPSERPDGVLPYPYHIDETGGVGRQEFWKGKPLLLMGFAEKGKHIMSLTFEEFWKKPNDCIGLYPVFEHRGGKWFTYSEQIRSVSINK